MRTTRPPTDRTAAPTVGAPWSHTVETARVIAVTGIVYGVVVAGAGGRLAMLLLRHTSPDHVHGITSDDGFTIGTFTLAGTYNLLHVGALVGVIGAATYRLVAPRLIGPPWFQQLTVGLASGAVAGSMLVHTDGVDFAQLTPTWLAVGLFIALPSLFGAYIAPVYRVVAAPGSRTTTGRRRWLLPLALIACFPATLVPLAAICLGIATITAAGQIDLVHRLRSTTTAALAIRTAWLLVAGAGLNALMNDIIDLT